jgi:hypothetical protein
VKVAPGVSPSSVWAASHSASLALAGRGGEDLTPFAAELFSFMNPGFTGMMPPALIVAGDDDQSMLSVRGPDWWTDAYHLSPASKSLLTLFGAQHSLGGITGYSVTETTDESPERVALLQRLTVAWMRSALHAEDPSWTQARTALEHSPQPLGQIESK